MSSSRRRGRPPTSPVKSTLLGTVTMPAEAVADAIGAPSGIETPAAREAAPAEFDLPSATDVAAEAEQDAPLLPEPVQAETPIETIAAVEDVARANVEGAATAPETIMAEAVETASPPIAVPEIGTAAEVPPQGGPAAASVAFAPALVPFTEINTTLFAFARGEGAAALAHLQALSQARSPAEAIRLQVAEMQRAADASLTCFSRIVRSANRMSAPAR